MKNYCIQLLHKVILTIACKFCLIKLNAYLLYIVCTLT